MSTRRLHLIALLALSSVTPLGAGEVTVYRDTWGVPHVYGDSAEAAMFGHGYAQAEDRLDDLLGAYLVGLGRAASVFGEDLIERDLVARMGRHEELARERYPELGLETRKIIESFVTGVQAYMDEHPERVPAWATRPEPHHVIALYRAFIWAWPFGQARGDLKRAGSHVGDGRGSNQWVVGAARSAAGAPIAMFDPHLSWEPQNLFYEAHVHGGDLDFFGFSIVGTPLMALGHTDVFSLALTTGGPDCADVYEERIHPEDPLRYEYDGEWRKVETAEIVIDVKTDEGMRRRSMTIERTHHGPILERDGDRAWSMRTGYDGEIGLVEQWLGMIRADNLGEFLEAMSANQSLPQNVMYADVHDNIYYVRAGRVPVRPPGYAWDRPVPGWTSKTEWRGIHRPAELVQVLNPPAGYMQNTNVSPGMMMPSSPLTAERYPAVIYNTTSQRSNDRGRRAVELLGSTAALTVERALRIAVDTRVDSADHWQAALRRSYERHGAGRTDLQPAVDLLQAWDGHMDVDSRAATLFREWMRASRSGDSGVPWGEVDHGEPIEEGEETALLEALSAAVETLRERHGRFDVPWGEVHRLRRGDRSWPVAGCRADGISTLRSVRFGSPDEDGISWARGGQMCTTVVLLEKGAVRSWSATPFGQSADPASPHHADQADALFSGGLLKPTWYPKAELLRHLESKRTLVVPERGGD